MFKQHTQKLLFYLDLLTSGGHLLVLRILEVVLFGPEKILDFDCNSSVLDCWRFGNLFGNNFFDALKTSSVIEMVKHLRHIHKKIWIC